MAFAFELHEKHSFHVIDPAVLDQRRITLSSKYRVLRAQEHYDHIGYALISFPYKNIIISM